MDLDDAFEVQVKRNLFWLTDDRTFCNESEARRYLHQVAHSGKVVRLVRVARTVIESDVPVDEK